jgi:hypothetical protein
MFDGSVHPNTLVKCDSIFTVFPHYMAITLILFALKRGTQSNSA